MRDAQNSDKVFLEAMNKYDNIYTAMTFDDQPTDMRAPIKLPKRLKYNHENKSKINISKKYGFKNCRALIPELMNGNVHIGLANVVRNSDGIIREAAPLMEYRCFVLFPLTPDESRPSILRLRFLLSGRRTFCEILDKC